MTRSTIKDVRDLADQFFTDLIVGQVPLVNPLFQEALEARIDALLSARKPRTPEADDEHAVLAIIHDLSGRSGLHNCWDGIDPDIRAEIRAKWVELVRKERAKG